MFSWPLCFFKCPLTYVRTHSLSLHFSSSSWQGRVIAPTGSTLFYLISFFSGSVLTLFFSSSSCYSFFLPFPLLFHAWLPKRKWTSFVTANLVVKGFSLPLILLLLMPNHSSFSMLFYAIVIFHVSVLFQDLFNGILR